VTAFAPRQAVGGGRFALPGEGPKLALTTLNYYSYSGRMVDRDPTDLGLSPHLSDDDLAAIRHARLLGLIAADVPSGPPATAESRARILERARAGSRRSRRLPPRRCTRCQAEPWMWCRRSASANRQPGFVHPERDSAES
jgi:hypothetical protein